MLEDIQAKLNLKWRSKLLNKNDMLEIQNFLWLFNDFFLLCEGTFGTAEEVLTACPPSKDLTKDKLLLGIYSSSRILIGLIDIIKDYPEKGTWTIGYLLIHPQYRNHGVGTQLLQDLSSVLKKFHVLKIRCIAQKQNTKAVHFWQRNEFTKVKELEEISGKLTNIVLEKLLA